jgi:hypothetical protein
MYPAMRLLNHMVSWLLNHRVSLILAFWGIPISFSKVAVIIYITFPLTLYQNSFCIFSLTFFVFHLFYNNHSSELWWILIVVLVCLLLLIRNVELKVFLLRSGTVTWATEIRRISVEASLGKSSLNQIKKKLGLVACTYVLATWEMGGL